MSGSFSQGVVTRRPTRRRCLYCYHRCEHPSFVFITSINTAGRATGLWRDESFIGVSSNPNKRLLEINRMSPTGRVGGRTTGPPAPFWQLELVIGPIYARCKAKKFQTEWRQRSRTLRNRIFYGMVAARGARLGIYARNPHTTVLLAQSRGVSDFKINK